VDDSSSISAQEIAARGRLAVKQNGVKLIIVDYVQLIEAKGRDERERVSNVSRHLRALAKDAAPVLALSQMPRPKDDLNRWPTKYDLKESGSLENDSSTILMIFRKVNRETSLPTGEDYIVVPKQRHGPVGFEPVTFNEDRLIYRSRAVGEVQS
jgi:replicative DNA helicase